MPVLRDVASPTRPRHATRTLALLIDLQRETRAAPNARPVSCQASTVGDHASTLTRGTLWMGCCLEACCSDSVRQVLQVEEVHIAREIAEQPEEVCVDVKAKAGARGSRSSRAGASPL
jgi:hypothetical protein